MKCACRKLYTNWYRVSLYTYKRIYTGPELDSRAQHGRNKRWTDVRTSYSGPRPTPRISHFWRLVRDWCGGGAHDESFPRVVFPPSCLFFPWRKKSIKSFSLFIIPSLAGGWRRRWQGENIRKQKTCGAVVIIIVLPKMAVLPLAEVRVPMCSRVQKAYVHDL